MQAAFLVGTAVVKTFAEPSSIENVTSDARSNGQTSRAILVRTTVVFGRASTARPKAMIVASCPRQTIICTTS